MKMRKSTYFRIFIATVLIVFISFSLLGGLSSAFSYSRSINEKREMMISTLNESARYIATQHIHYGVNLNDLDLAMWLAVTSRITNMDLLITDADGAILSGSDPFIVHSGKTVPKSILEATDIRERSVVRSTLGEIYPAYRQTAGMPLSVNVGGELRTYGYLFVTSDIEAFGREWRKFTAAFVFCSLSVMLLAFAISFVSLKRQVKPLNEMASVAHRFARGEFDVRVRDTCRVDEIGQLTKAFNLMADSMENSEQQRREFVSNLSHELKTPMTVISGFAEGLLDGTIPRENEKRYLEVISSETKRISRLVRSMLEISKIGKTDAKVILERTFDITEVARLAILSLGGKIAERQQSIEAQLPDEAITTRGDKDSITQVVYNLIDNAIKFSADNGVIRIELWRQNERVFVSVTNHGETIPEEELPFIFQRFHKADKSRSSDRDGVGLGLYIVKAILDNHNEDIFVTSSGGVTKFIFSLTAV